MRSRCLPTTSTWMHSSRIVHQHLWNSHSDRKCSMCCVLACLCLSRRIYLSCVSILCWFAG
jgi:hypothetical protein